MPTKSQDIQIQRGDTVYFDFTVSGLSVPLADCLVWFTAKEAISDTDDDAVIRKTLTSGISVQTDLAGNSVGTVQIDPADTAGIVMPTGIDDPAWSASLLYDIQIKTPAGEVFTVLKGRLIVSMDVTQATAYVVP